MRPPKWLPLLAIAAGAAAQDFTVFKTPAESPRRQLADHLNSLGQDYLRQRDAAIARITTREAMEQRKQQVREALLQMLGGLPERRGPLNVKQIETLDRGDYRIEKIVYESLPGFYVTANVYAPASGSGPFPGILMPAGHWDGGKEGERDVAIGLARKGFVVLKPDPLGQGERLQYYDPDLRRSKVGIGTTEHSHANGHTMLIGDNVARYFVWDGIRGIDYLSGRKDVDPARIGVTGCSGGGTLTTYISVLDDRVKAAAPACYITAWQELLPGRGPQDAEQSFPGFLRSGLNFADYIELFAPKPWLVVNTREDFFPLEGARRTVEEARRIYALYGAGDRLGWSVGPGGHGVPLECREAIYAWFIKWLNDGKGDPRETPAVLDPPDNLLVTRTGQVADSLGGETVFTLNRKRAADLIPAKQPVNSPADVDRLRDRLRREIPEVASISIQPGGPAPEIRVHSSADREGYRLDVISMQAPNGVRLPGLLATPRAPGSKRAAVLLDPRPKQTLAAPGGDFDDLARAGFLVLALQPSGVAEEGPDSSPVGDHSIALRAAIVGKTVLGLRVEDAVRAVDWVASQPDVDGRSIACLGYGELGPVVLHAAVLDNRIRRVVLQNSLVAYRMAIERPIHRHIHEMAPAGVLRKYDLDELAAAVAPRPLAVVNPTDALGIPIRPAEFRDWAGYAASTYEKIGEGRSIRVLRRERGERLAPLLDQGR